MGAQRRQHLLLPPDGPGQRSIQRGIGQRSPLPPLGRDQVGHSFRLGQAELPVQESAAGILARGSGRRTCGNAAFHQAACHRSAAVTGQLHHILPGIAVGRPEEQGHSLVKTLPVLHKTAEQCGIALGILHTLGRVLRTEHLLCHSIALRPGQTHHRNAPRSRRCGNGGDRGMLHTLSPFFLVYGLYCTTKRRKRKRVEGTGFPHSFFLLWKNPPSRSQKRPAPKGRPCS